MILVTGASGVLGSNLLFELSSREKKIRAMYRDQKRVEKVRQLFDLLSHDKEEAEKRWSGIEWFSGDILDVIALKEAMKGVDEVFHCAAMVSYRRRDFIRMMQVNGAGTANVVNMALEEGVKRFCHVSSTAAVGKEKHGTIYKVSETNKWTQDKNTSGYAISKHTAEKEVWRAMEEGLDAVIINPSVILGPGNWEDSSLTILGSVEKGMLFYTEGSNAFVDVREVVRSAIFLMESGIKGQRYLCTGTNIPFRELFKRIAQELGKKEPKFRAGRLACELAWRLDSLKAVFTGHHVLTKESVHSAQSKVEYDSSKLSKLLEPTYPDLIETIRYAVKNRLN
ncbi:MAG: NAD-dependent epimerase/dehydratase family protein [Bacteroidetes bacterium]|nr:MAG: NAD-dependent epimerase/dehydratase family protein [Bacteroidota bacterium]